MTIRYHPTDEQPQQSDQAERSYMTTALTMEQGELALFSHPCACSSLLPHRAHLPQPCALQCGTNPNCYFHKHLFFILGKSQCTRRAFSRNALFV